MTDDHGRVLVMNSQRYLFIAHEARDRATEIMSADPSQAPDDCLVSMIFSALAVEAFINDLAEAADMDANARDRYGIKSLCSMCSGISRMCSPRSRPIEDPSL